MKYLFIDGSSSVESNNVLAGCIAEDNRLGTGVVGVAHRRVQSVDVELVVVCWAGLFGLGEERDLNLALG